MESSQSDAHAIPEDVLSKLGKRYTSFQYVSSGATSAVYKVHDQILDKIVALKILKRPEYRDLIRFQKEAQAASQLEHKNLVKIMDFNITSKNHAFLIMEYLEGEDLDEILEKEGILSIDMAINIACQIADGMSHAHSKKIAHRDLKASNIIVNDLENPHITVVDFGLAKKQAQDDTVVVDDLGITTTTTGVIQGSPLYMSPEQAQGKEADERADIYGLGCIFFKMLTGRTPFESDQLMPLLKMHIEDPPPKLIDKNPDGEFSPELEDVVAKMLEKLPQDRHQTMQELKEDLISLSNAKDLVTAEPKQNDKKKDSRPLKQILLASIFGSIVCSIVFFMINGKTPPEIPVQNIELQNFNTSIEKFKITSNDPRGEGYKSKWFQWSSNELNPQDFENLSLFLQEKKQIPVYSNLSFRRAHISGEDLNHLKSNRIVYLDFSDALLDDSAFEALTEFSNLELLILDDTMTKNSQLNLLWNCKSLKEIYLNNCPKISAPGFEGICNCKNLSSLHFNTTKAPAGKRVKKQTYLNENVNLEAIKYISENPSLERLFLDSTSINDDCVELILTKPFRKDNPIVEMDMDNCSAITGRTLELFSRLNPDVEYLGLASTSIKTADLHYLQHLKNLHLLNLMGITVDEPMLKIIGGLPKIQNLYIGNLTCTDEAMNCLHNFEDPANLVFISAPRVKKSAFDALEKRYKTRKNGTNRDIKIVAPTAQVTENINDLGKELLDVTEF